MPDANPNITELRKLIHELDEILADPEPGLWTWQQLYVQRAKAMLMFFGVNSEVIKD